MLIHVWIRQKHVTLIDKPPLLFEFRSTNGVILGTFCYEEILVAKDNFLDRYVLIFAYICVNSNVFLIFSFFNPSFKHHAD